MGWTSAAVCGVVPVAATRSAGIVACRIDTGTIGIIEGPLSHTTVYISPPLGAVFQARSLDNQEGANTERCVFAKL